MDLTATAFWLPILEIIWIDILLSGDNAVIIALACRSLPQEQRTLGVILGSGAAIALRVAFTIIIVQLLDLPFVKIVGGLLLLWIAIRLASTEEPQKEIRPAKTLWSAIRTVAAADAIMSLDNMLAVAAAAKGSMLLILFGLGLSIPLLISGSALLLSLFNRFPIFVWAGVALIGLIAGDLIGSDPNIATWLRVRWAAFHMWDGPLGAALVIAASWLRRRRMRAANGT
jgi:YjbE family integral membrane protein